MSTIPEDVKLILDLTIGDGYLGLSGNTEYPKYRCEHSIKQKEYADHKNQLLKDAGYKTNYRIITSNNPRQFGKQYCRLDIYGDQRLKTARKYLYNKQIKTVDKKLLGQLDERSLAYWFMDDGSAKTVERSADRNIVRVYESRKTHSYKLSTNCFSLGENELIRAWLLDRFSVESTISKSPSNSGFFLYIAQTESKDVFRNTIKDYILPSMEYKIACPHSFVGIPHRVLPRNET